MFCTEGKALQAQGGPWRTEERLSRPAGRAYARDTVEGLRGRTQFTQVLFKLSDQLTAVAGDVLEVTAPFIVISCFFISVLLCRSHEV